MKDYLKKGKQASIIVSGFLLPKDTN